MGPCSTWRGSGSWQKPATLLHSFTEYSQHEGQWWDSMFVFIFFNISLNNRTGSLQVIHVLDMTSAQLHSLVLGAEESLHSLQLRLETHTQSHISPLSQELLLETGISLDPRRPPTQCLPDGLVWGINVHFSSWSWFSYFLFDVNVNLFKTKWSSLVEISENFSPTTQLWSF